MRLAPFAVTFAFLIALNGAQAYHCPHTTPATAEAGGYYFLIEPGVCYPLMIYQESNGIPGLQRNDHCVDGTCGIASSDRLIY